MLMKKVPNLGCVVDLTATYRYYDPTVKKKKVLITHIPHLSSDHFSFQVFTSRGIRHEKV